MSQTYRTSHFPSKEQLLREGRYFETNTPYYTSENTYIPTFGSEIGELVHKNEPGRSSLVTSTIVSSTGKVQTNKGVLNGNSISSTSEILLGSEEEYKLKFNYIGESGQVVPYISGSISGIEFTSDYNFSAKKVIGVIGGTTSYGGMETDPNGNSFPGEYLWCFQVTSILRILGKSVRLVNKSVPEMTSTKMESLRKSNFYDFDYDLLLVNLGPETTTELNFKGNLSKLISMRNTNRPLAPIIFISCFPTDKNVTDIRTWMEDVVTMNGGATSNLWFIDGSSSFGLNSIPTDDINFAISQRSLGNRVNYSGYGQANNANKVISEIQNMPWLTNF